MRPYIAVQRNPEPNRAMSSTVNALTFFETRPRPATRPGLPTRILRRLQIARMEAALARFDDAQLARLGLRRDDIAAHAERLVG